MPSTRRRRGDEVASALVVAEAEVDGALERRAEDVVEQLLLTLLVLVEVEEATEALCLERHPEPEHPPVRRVLGRRQPLRRVAQRTPRLVQAPRVVAVGVPLMGPHVEAAAVDLDPSLGRSALRVAGLIRRRPAALLGEVVCLLVGRGQPQPVEVEGDPGFVGLEHESDVSKGPDELVTQRADPGREVRSPDPAGPHRALQPPDADAGVAADHVGVGSHPHPRVEEDLGVGAVHAEVVAVVPVEVVGRDLAEGVGVLVDRELVVVGQHTRLPTRVGATVPDAYAGSSASRSGRVRSAASRAASAGGIARISSEMTSGPTRRRPPMSCRALTNRGRSNEPSPGAGGASTCRPTSSRAPRRRRR